jgi:hypothetical protein
MRSLFQRKQNFGCPPADEDRGNHFASCILFIMLCLRRKGLDETTFRIRISRLSLALGTVPPCQSLRVKCNQEHMCTCALLAAVGCSIWKSMNATSGSQACCYAASIVMTGKVR